MRRHRHEVIDALKKRKDHPSALVREHVAWALGAPWRGSLTACCRASRRSSSPAPDDYDGRVVATLVRLPAADAPRGARVLYVHGFIDYFFQRHMAERFAAEGYAFYALDLRKHGRSLLPHQHPCFCKDIAEYYADITRALEEIGADVLLAGHSTGGLICSLYAHEGELRDRVRALWLNSPFFDWRDEPRGQAAHRRAARPLLSVHEQSQGRAAGLRAKPAQELGRRVGFRSGAQAAVRISGLLRLGAGDLRRARQGARRARARLSRCCRCTRTRPTSCSTGSRSRAGRARWGRRSACCSFPAGCTTWCCRAREIRDEVFSQLFAWAARA